MPSDLLTIKQWGGHMHAQTGACAHTRGLPVCDFHIPARVPTYLSAQRHANVGPGVATAAPVTVSAIAEHGQVVTATAALGLQPQAQTTLARETLTCPITSAGQRGRQGLHPGPGTACPCFEPRGTHLSLDSTCFRSLFASSPTETWASAVMRGAEGCTL